MSEIDPSKVDVQALINAAEQYLAIGSDGGDQDPGYFENIFKEALGLNPKVSELNAAIIELKAALTEHAEIDKRRLTNNGRVQAAREKAWNLLESDGAHEFEGRVYWRGNYRGEIQSKQLKA